MKRIISLFILMMMFAGVAQAQAPDQINIALTDLSTRLGTTITIRDLSNWRWSQETYPNTALGCAGVQGTGTDIAAYQFPLTYQGTTYDYRVSADGTVVVMCGQVDPNLPTATPDDNAPYSNPLCPAPDDLPFMRARVNIGMDVEVVESVLNLRAAPASNAEVLTQIPVNSPFRIDGGPSCIDNLVWWYVNHNGQLGYVAEGQAGEYFIQPKTPTPLQNRQILDDENIELIREFSVVEGNFVPHIAWSPDSVRMALPGATGSDSLWIYRTDALTLTPDIIEDDEAMTTLEFRPNNTQIMFGTAEGTIHLWNIVPDPNNTVAEALFLNTHQANITSIALNPDGARFISAGQNALTTVNVDRTYAAIIWDIPTVTQLAVISGHTGLIRDMAWSPDGTQIVTVSDDGTARWWDANTGAALNNVALDEGALTAVEYSPNGQFVAVGTSQIGQVVLFDAVTKAEVATYTVNSAGIAGIDFSPDSALLVIGGSDNTVSIWSTQNDQPLTTFSVNDPVRDVAFSNDGTFLTIATEKPSVLFYGVPFGG